ncbi:MAG: FAD-binding oxidoreductase [Clostridiales bacterium]|jgi:FAD/FMN-containing dehydrogenase|nr:FAD-binding oxidoreductase [Clostridiales bacterium]
MDKEKLIAQLKKIVGDDCVSAEENVILECSKDYIGFRQFERGAGKYFVPRAACVVSPKNADEVGKVLSFLNKNAVDVVPRTGSSSVTLGVEPREGGVILDGSKLNGVIELNETDMWVTVGAGTPLEYLEGYLNKRGYTTGHFPQSLPMAHVGGLLATRSIGQFSTLYGGIEDLTVGLEAVTADGEIIKIKNSPRRSVGPDLRQIFIGSEGTLGFITQATLKIFGYSPETRWMNAYAVKGMKNGLKALREIMVRGYRPAVVRLHDPIEMERDLGNAAPEGYCILILLAEGPKAVTESIGCGIDAVLKEFDALDLGKKPVERWLEHRNDVCATLDEHKYYRLGAVVDTCEISAPWSKIGDIYEAVLERMPREVESLVSIAGHSSHSYMQGTNIYFTFGAMADKDKPEEVRGVYMNIIRVIMEETLARGGSIAHHHGSGKYRTRWMPQEHGSSYEIMRKLKRALDPNGIFNKGVLFGDETD